MVEVLYILQLHSLFFGKVNICDSHSYLPYLYAKKKCNIFTEILVTTCLKYFHIITVH